MDMKYVISLFVLFGGMVVAVTGEDAAEGDALMKAMSSGLMTMGKQAEGGKGDYNPLCDFGCKIENLNDKPKKPECKEIPFNNIACPYYKEGDNLNCYACNTLPDCSFSCPPKFMNSLEVHRSSCPVEVENTPSLSWPCIGQLVTTDNLYVELYTGYNLGKPVCLRRSYRGNFPKKLLTGGSFPSEQAIFTVSVRTCGVDLGDQGEGRCEDTTQDEVDRFLAPLKVVYGPDFEMDYSKTCYFEGNSSSNVNDTEGGNIDSTTPRRKRFSRNRSADSYYCIWTLVLGLVAILTSVEVLLVELI